MKQTTVLPEAAENVGKAADELRTEDHEEYTRAD
jgi:hypothetical protein